MSAEPWEWSDVSDNRRDIDSLWIAVQMARAKARTKAGSAYQPPRRLFGGRYFTHVRVNQLDLQDRTRFPTLVASALLSILRHGADAGFSKDVTLGEIADAGRQEWYYVENIGRKRADALDEWLRLYTMKEP